MKDVVPHKDRAFPLHLELGPSPSDFVLSSVLGPFLGGDEELGRSRELVDLFESKVVNFPMSSSRSRKTLLIPLGLLIPPMPLAYSSSSFTRYLYSVKILK